MSRRHVAARNRFVCTGEFVGKSLSLQQHFVSATSRTDSVWFDFLRLVAATKFCCGVKRFSQKFSSTQEAICRWDVSPHRVATTSTHEATMYIKWAVAATDLENLNIPLKGPAWQNIAGKKWHPWTQKKHLELFTSRRHFGEINQPKTLLLLHQRANHADHRKSICVSRPY